MEYQRDTWANVAREIGPLWQAHYDEIADHAIPLQPAWKGYEQLSKLDVLEIISARSNGKLVGYAFALVNFHLHYATTLFANFDLYYIDPKHRSGWAYVRLIKTMEQALKQRGVVKIVGNTKLAHDASPVFRRLGWHETERIYTKRL